MFGWTFDLTSRGGAVVERLKVGTPTEMTTVYHLENGKLIGDHYCQLGNQPHLTAVRMDGEGDLLLERTALKKRSHLFERTFDMDLKIRSGRE